MLVYLVTGIMKVAESLLFRCIYMVLLISYGTLIAIYITIQNSYQGLQKNSQRDDIFIF